MNALLITANDNIKETIQAYADEKSLQLIYASNKAEAKLKAGGKTYDYIFIDLEFREVDVKKFLNSIRRKEELKNVRNTQPLILIGKDPKSYAENFSDIEHHTFLEVPFKTFDVSKKILSFSGKADTLENNTFTVKQGDYLIKEGAQGHDMYWVTEGKFIISKENESGHKVIIGEVNPGELVGEMSFLDDLPRSASVKAEIDSEVLKIPHRKFMDTLDNQPRWFRSLMRTLSQRMRASNEKIAKKNVSVERD